MRMLESGADASRKRSCRRLAVVIAGCVLVAATQTFAEVSRAAPRLAAAADDQPSIGPVAVASPNDDRRASCIASEYRDLIARFQNRRVEAEVCELPCLPPPPLLAPDQARNLERRLGLKWCQRCVMVRNYLAPDEIERIEQAGGIQLCRDAASTALARAAPVAAGIVQDAMKKVRSVFAREGRVAARHEGLAIVIGNARYGQPIPARPSAERNAAAMQLVLVERAGFRADNIIVALDATRAELERVLGPIAGGAGEIANRMKTQAAPSLFVYVASHGGSGEDSGEAYIMPSDGQPRREEQTGYPLAALYRNLARLGIPEVQVVLEVEFSRDPGALVLAPNAPSNRVNALPPRPVAGLAVFTAAERDQKALDDPETGLGLFTRHLIEALSGAADARPIGNGDGIVDSTEAFVFAAARTQVAARKSFGVLQRPQLSQVRAISIAKTGTGGAER